MSPSRCMYPDGGVSDIQYQPDGHAARIKRATCGRVRGNFDDCQTGVKNVFGDAAFAEKLLSEHGISLSSANSINWGRLLPQVVYYMSAYSQLVADGKLDSRRAA